MKHEYKKHEKEFYSPKPIPTLVNIPSFNFFCIKGKGNPNGEDFAKRLTVLYSLSYTAKMLPRKGIEVPNYFEYTVYPLEGTWTLSEKGIKEQLETNNLNKDELEYTIMIRQPSFIYKEIASLVIEMVKKNKPNELLKDAYFTEVKEGICVQMLHVGSYDTEALSFSKMKEFIKENNYKLKTLEHREIYLSDARKTAPDKLKTILRYRVDK